MSLLSDSHAADAAAGFLEFEGPVPVDIDAELWPRVRAAAEPLGLVPRDARDAGSRGALRVDADLGPEAYRLSVRRDGLDVAGGDAAGVAAGLTALRHMLPSEGDGRSGRNVIRLPLIETEDRPAHAWRGFMLDVARWYVPVAEILQLIDRLAWWRLNVLHLHLTDDQGWRLAIERWPRLTEVGAWRAGTTTRPAPVVGEPDPRVADDWGSSHLHDGIPHGGYYTADDIAEIVAYAAARHITVVPEIDVPGHTQAVVAAYPEFGFGGPAVPVATRWGISPHTLRPSPESLRFAQSVLAEVADMFPGPFVHVGGDECPTDEWDRHPATRDDLRRLGLPDASALRPWFIGRCVDALAERGKTALYWFDGEVLAPDAIAVAWRGDDAARDAARQGVRVVSAPHERTYLDYFAEPVEIATHGWGLVNTVEDARRFRPVPAGTDPELAARFLGAQAQLWTEYAPNREARDALLTPRLGVLAQNFWRGGP